MDKKFLLWASKYRVALLGALVIIAIIAIRPMYWLGSIGFGWVVFWLVVAVVVLLTYLRSYKTESKPFLVDFLFATLIVGTILAGILLWSSRPEFNAGEVKTIMNYEFSRVPISYRPHFVSVEYQGNGKWRVTAINNEMRTFYEIYDETPAIFSVTQLLVSPLQVQVSEAVEITITITNSGGSVGIYPLVLKINDVEWAEKNITISAGSTETTHYLLTVNQAGNYMVTVGGLNASFTVGAPPKRKFSMEKR